MCASCKDPVARQLHWDLLTLATRAYPNAPASLAFLPLHLKDTGRGAPKPPQPLKPLKPLGSSLGAT